MRTTFYPIQLNILLSPLPYYRPATDAATQVLVPRKRKLLSHWSRQAGLRRRRRLLSWLALTATGAFEGVRRAPATCGRFHKALNMCLSVAIGLSSFLQLPRTAR